MRLNQELRTRHMVLRYRLLWVFVYIILAGILVVAGLLIYLHLDDDRLPNGYVSLTVDKERYQLGESISFTVSNHFPTAIYITNSCPQEPLHVYRWENNYWRQIHDIAVSQDSDCFRQPRRIEVAAEYSLQYNFDDWPDLFSQPGVYRIVMEVEHYDQLPYQDFAILEPVVEVSPPLQQQPTTTQPSAPSNSQEDQSEEQEEDYEEEHEDQEIEENDD